MDVFFVCTGPGRGRIEGSKCSVLVLFLDFFGSEMCLVAWWIWPGRLLVPGSNGALPNTSQNLQNNKIKIPSPRPPFDELENRLLFPYQT